MTNKPQHVSIYLPEDLRQRLAAEAKRERRSLSAQIVFWLEKIFADDSKEPESK